MRLRYVVAAFYLIALASLACGVGVAPPEPEPEDGVLVFDGAGVAFHDDGAGAEYDYECWDPMEAQWVPCGEAELARCALAREIYERECGDGE